MYAFTRLQYLEEEVHDSGSVLSLGERRECIPHHSNLLLSVGTTFPSQEGLCVACS
jgi:hypothetical protein